MDKFIIDGIFNMWELIFKNVDVYETVSMFLENDISFVRFTHAKLVIHCD